MKLRHSRTQAAAVLGFWAVLAGDVAAADASDRRSRVVARGVIAPALAKTRPHAAKGRRGHDDIGGPAITFTGFHVFDDGRSRIFVKLTSEVPVEARYSGKRIEYVFKGAKIPVRNNRNALITEHFPASIVSARYAADKKKKGRDKTFDARLEIVLREESKPAHKVERQGDGTAIFTVDLPKPSTPPPPAPVPTAPSRKPDRGGDGELTP
jgi:hypothetical protein